MTDVWLRDTQWRVTKRAPHATAFANEARGLRSQLLRDVVVRQARLDGHEDPRSAATDDPAVAAWRVEAARLTFEMDTDAARDHRALAQFDAACAADPDLRYSRQGAQALATVLWNLGEYERLANEERLFEALDPVEEGFLRADLIGASHGVDSTQWLDHVNGHLGEVWEQTPMSFAGGSADLFDQLEAASERTVSDGPLVTVIMPTHRRGREIVTAVKSILRQTWRNLELVIVDDASGPEFDDRLEEVAGLDPRVRLIRLERNVGAYGARNVALQSVRGEFVTFQDDDDWSHPERIERQVMPLIADSDLCSTISRCARATDEMVFRYRGQRVLRPNASSLMFRRADVDVVGYFDATRKAGDTEHAFRLVTMTGGTHLDLPDVLALVRLTGGSLSRSDFGVGWRHPSRSEYREAFMHFHERLARGGAQVPGPSSARKFPAPRRFLTDEQLKSRPSRYDMVFARDWRRFDVGSHFALAALRHASAAGWRVGVMHLPDPRQPGTWATPIAPELRSLIHDGVVDRVLTNDEVEVGTLVIEDPALLQVAERTPWSLDVDRVVFVPLDLPREAGEASAWSAEAVTELAAEYVGAAQVEWMAGDAKARRARLLAGAALEAVRDSKWRTGRLAPPALDTARIVVGATGADPSIVKLPDSRRLDVRIVIDPAHEYLAHGAPATSLIYRTSDVGFRAFINQLDFYLLGDPAGSGIEARATALRAAALGRVVVADPAFEPDLGAAAIYRTSEQVPETLEELAADRSAYDVQVARAAARVSDAIADREVLASLAQTEKAWRAAQS
ncbi:glycosyltransferase family 2 protein [Demequina sp. SO4-18]|uniref:glycosyltransferase family 2 protein n=1 Tax=Demequina sp. SO4-18 TaxID=3401026 RepID=UPI003B5B6E09